MPAVADHGQVRSRRRSGLGPIWKGGLGLACLLLCAGRAQAAATTTASGPLFPPTLESYGDSHLVGLWDVLRHRMAQQPLDLWVTILFLAAIVHTFFTSRFTAWSFELYQRQRSKGQPPADHATGITHASIASRVLLFLGEIEVVFGIWCVPLFILLAVKIGWTPAVDYFSHGVSYVEPVFVVVIMAIASTRPILMPAERCLRRVAKLGGGGPGAWWLTILTLGPVLGSLITEPAAMTISALVLAKQFFALKPSPRLAYGTLALLFVNVSVGGSLTHFAAPPVLMVAGPWGWTTSFMFTRFGRVALAGIVVSNVLYYLALRKEFSRMGSAKPLEGESLRETPIATEFHVDWPDLPAGETSRETPVPLWVTGVHLACMAWAVMNAHYPVLLIGGLLFFLAFYEVTREYQSDFQLRSPLLVGFFLAGLVIHGGLQQWWIQPMLSRLTEVPLMLGATALTAFNDNAAITFLATLVPSFTDSLRYAVVAGAIAGGGLTVIANAPNPAGLSVLSKYFPNGVSPLGLLAAAFPATVIMVLCFLFAR